MRFCLLFLALGACSTPFGQKVTILLSDREVDCQERSDGKLIATLELDQLEDFYQVELVDSQTDEAYLLPAVRNGREVTFECPEGFESLLVRHATILQALRENGSTGSSSGAP